MKIFPRIIRMAGLKEQAELGLGSIFGVIALILAALVALVQVLHRLGLH